MQSYSIISILCLLHLPLFLSNVEAIKGRNSFRIPSSSTEADSTTTSTNHSTIILGSSRTQQHSEQDQKILQRKLNIEKIWNWYQPQTSVSEIVSIYKILC